MPPDDDIRRAFIDAEGAGLYLDYSKHRVTGETIGRLVALADDCGLPRAETGILADMMTRRIQLGRREDILVQGEASSRIGVLAEGWAFAYQLLPVRRRKGRGWNCGREFALSTAFKAPGKDGVNRK